MCTLLHDPQASKGLLPGRGRRVRTGSLPQSLRGCHGTQEWRASGWRRQRGIWDPSSVHVWKGADGEMRGEEDGAYSAALSHQVAPNSCPHLPRGGEGCVGCVVGLISSHTHTQRHSHADTCPHSLLHADTLFMQTLHSGLRIHPTQTPQGKWKMFLRDLHPFRCSLNRTEGPSVLPE